VTIAATEARHLRLGDNMEIKSVPRRRAAHPDRKRKDLREQLWPGSAQWVWGEEQEVGYVKLPRLIPLVLALIKHLSAGEKTGDPSSVYLDLWCRSMGQGIVTITDEEDCAYSSGYTSTRAVRTWRGHMFQLVTLGFLLAKTDGNREFGQILLLNPLAVCARLHAERKDPDGWWASFVRRANYVGAQIPAPLSSEGANNIL
jgi:hypothetical protein